MDGFITLNNVSGGYGEQTVLEGVSFGVPRGDFLGVIGPNGSGKSTLLRLMSKTLSPSRGEILLEGRDIRTMSLKEYCAVAAFVSASSFEGLSFTVWETVLMGRLPHLSRFQAESRADFEAAEESLALTGTTALRNKAIDELSAGERQRVIIARALCQEPKLLFLDEPTSHLDIGHQIQILDLLRSLNRTKNLTIVMVIHDLNLAGEYCNRLILLNEGHICKNASPEEVLTYQNIEQVYKTIVVVKTNPISGKPFVILVSGNRSQP